MEKHRHVRSEARYELNLKINLSAKKHPVLAGQEFYTNNISRKGLFVNCPHSIGKINEPVDFTIIRAVEPHLSGKALIRWYKENTSERDLGVGLEIIQFKSQFASEEFAHLVSFLE